MDDVYRAEKLVLLSRHHTHRIAAATHSSPWNVQLAEVSALVNDGSSFGLCDVNSNQDSVTPDITSHTHSAPTHPRPAEPWKLAVSNPLVMPASRRRTVLTSRFAPIDGLGFVGGARPSCPISCHAVGNQDRMVSVSATAASSRRVAAAARTLVAVVRSGSLSASYMAVNALTAQVAASSRNWSSFRSIGW